MPHTSQMDIARPRAGAVVVELLGEHDIASKGKLDQLLTSLVRNNDLLVIDVSETEFIDASVLAALARASKLAKEAGTHLRLQVGADANVRRVLELTGFLKAFDCAADREHALAHAEGTICLI